jgi:hypothetical protein
MECGGNGAENGFQSRPFLPPFHRYIDTCGFLLQIFSISSPRGCHSRPSMLLGLSYQTTLILLKFALTCCVKPAKKPPIRPRWTREGPLSGVRSLYDCRAEVIITHAPITSDAYATCREVYCQSSPSALLAFCV